MLHREMGNHEDAERSWTEAMGVLEVVLKGEKQTAEVRQLEALWRAWGGWGRLDRGLEGRPPP